MSTPKKVILAKTADWDPWIFFVRNRAKSSRIWDLVDPNLTERPQQLQPPMVPTFVIPPAGTPLNKDTLEIYKVQNSLYKTQLAEYERQEKAFGDLIAFIQDTIAAHNVIFIQKEDSHPWNILRALKNRLVPSDEVRSLAIEQKYHKLCKGPGTQNLETWIDRWSATFTEAKEIAIGEVTGTRPTKDFLMAIREREPAFANAHLISLKKKKSGDLFELIEDFRQHIRLQQLHQSSKEETHSAFATKSGTSFRGQQALTPPKPCLCGDTHWLADCAYLVPEKRTPGWKSGLATEKKINDALQNDHTKAWVNRVLQKRKDKDNKTLEKAPTNASTSATPSFTGNMGAFTCLRTASSLPTYSLRSSWILNNGSNCHVCNSTMLSRFNKTRDAGLDDTLTAGTQVTPIECFGTIQISINTPTGPKTMTLLDVAYVSNFMANLVSQGRLHAKGLYFDNWKMHLHRQGETVGLVEWNNGHYLLENNISTYREEPVVSTTTHTRSLQDLHSAEGVKVVKRDDSQISKTNECETYPSSKTCQDVSHIDADPTSSVLNPLFSVKQEHLSSSTFTEEKIPDPADPSIQITDTKSDLEDGTTTVMLDTYHSRTSPVRSH